MKAIKACGYVTPKDYSAYLKFNLLKGRYYRYKVVAVLLSLTILSLALVFMGIIRRNTSLVFAGGAIVLCSLMFFYTVNNNVKKICNKSAKVIRAKQRVEFGKNGFAFELMFDNPEENEYSEIFYDELETIYLAPKAMYIYIEKRSVIVVPKRNLEITPPEAVAFLRKYLPAQKLVLCV